MFMLNLAKRWSYHMEDVLEVKKKFNVGKNSIFLEKCTFTMKYVCFQFV